MAAGESVRVAGIFAPAVLSAPATSPANNCASAVRRRTRPLSTLPPPLLHFASSFGTDARSPALSLRQSVAVTGLIVDAGIDRLEDAIQRTGREPAKDGHEDGHFAHPNLRAIQ